jgi:hypothetical protein
MRSGQVKSWDNVLLSSFLSDRTVNQTDETDLYFEGCENTHQVF